MDGGIEDISEVLSTIQRIHQYFITLSLSRTERQFSTFLYLAFFQTYSYSKGLFVLFCFVLFCFWSGPSHQENRIFLQVFLRVQVLNHI